MEPISVTVKSKRTYDSNRRQAQAQRNREAILDAAEELFLATGYAPTTINSIAEAAGISVETIYKAYGGKPGLVRAIRRRALEGEGPLSAEARSDEMQQFEHDPRMIITNWGKLAIEVGPRVAPILLLVRDAAANDYEMAALQKEIDTDRLKRMTRNAKRLREGGHLRSEITTKMAAEVLWTYSSPELYELLVIRLRWPLKRYGRFIANGMIAALLPGDPWTVDPLHNPSS